MYSKQYLFWGGLVLIVAGILGLIHVMGPTANNSIFGGGWFFTMGQSWINIVAGVIIMLLTYSEEVETRRTMAIIVGGLAVLLGLAGLFFPSSFAAILGANPENLVTNVFYLAFGAWGLWATLAGAEMPTHQGDTLQRAA